MTHLARCHFVFVFILPTLFCILIRDGAPQTIVMSVPEEFPVGTKVGMLSPTNQMAKFFPGTDESIPFRIDRDGGVYIAAPIDLETLCAERQVCCSHSAPCDIISDVLAESNEGINPIRLSVRIEDVNDHVPRFRHTGGQTVSFSEKALVGTTVSIEPAEDKDWSRENQIDRYILRGEALEQHFEIDYSTGRDVKLRLRELLDYERQRSFSGSLEVCDRQNCTTAPLTVNVLDVNDNLPGFHAPFVHHLNVSEDFPVNQVILQLNASDPDSPSNAQMRFEMVPSDDATVPTMFRLDPEGGSIMLAQKLNAHVRNEYRFKVRVKEATQSALISEIHQLSYHDQRPDVIEVQINVIDVNNFAPKIFMVDRPEGRRVVVMENKNPGRILVLQVTDRDLGDNGRVTCKLDSESVDQRFQLEHQSGTKFYSLHSLVRFDAEAEANILINVTCWDAGVPQQKSTRRIVIHIGDENEFAPTFSKEEYRASIKENSPVDRMVIQVHATDHDQSSHLIYSLTGDGERYFRIDPDTGKITTIGGGEHEASRLDREMTLEVNMLVLVRDADPSSSLDLRANPNDQSVVNTAQAKVTVKILDENDNEPQFTASGPFYLPENHSKYTKVNGHLNAMDPDEGLNGKIKYGLQDIWDTATGARKHNVFRLDETTGELQAMEELDREQVSEYTLRVVACDMAPVDNHCTRINVSVAVTDVNDNGPEWLFPIGPDEVVNVTSDAAPGQVIAQLVAHDRDAGQNGRVRYALHDPHSQVAFAVNETTGQITVADRYIGYLPPVEKLSSMAGQGGKAPSSVGASQSAGNAPTLYPGIHKLRIRASDMGHPPLHSDTWLTIRVVGVKTPIIGMQTGLLILVVLVTAIIAVCLTVAITCVRRQSKQSGTCKPCCVAKAASDRVQGGNSSCGHMAYILPQDPSGNYPEYPTMTSTFMKQSGLNYTIVSQKPAINGSICSGDHVDTYPIADMGVSEFYVPYYKPQQQQTQAMEVFMPQDTALSPEQMQFLESRVQEMSEIAAQPSSRSGSNLSFVRPDMQSPVEMKNFQSLKHSNYREVGHAPEQIPTPVRLLNHPMYSTCEAASPLMSFPQTTGSPEFHYQKRVDDGGQDFFEFNDAVIGLRGQNGLQNTSEQFEGGSADSGRGVSEDDHQLQQNQFCLTSTNNSVVLPYSIPSCQTSTFCPPAPTASFLKRACFVTPATVSEELTNNVA